MIVFYILVNICFPYHIAIIPIYIETNGFICTFCFIIQISSPTNSICGSMSRYYILDISSSSARRASTFSCSWIPSSFFSFKPPSSKVMWYLWLYLLFLSFPIRPCSSHGPISLYLLDCHKWKLENSFDKLPTCTSKFFQHLYVKPYSSPTPL